ncbi:MAG: hypothetical protein PSY14_00535 [bacterium]|nr:hypothetical protein [bacterium]
MALPVSFRVPSKPASTKDEVDALIAGLDADPSNTDKIFTFGNALYGHVPFRDKLFKAAQSAMLRNYNEIHIPQAASDAAAAEYAGTAEEAVKARHILEAMYRAKEHFIDQSEQNYYRMGKAAFAARKAEEDRLERQRMLAQRAIDAERRHVQAMVDDKKRIKGVTVQIGKLNQPVIAPKVATFKQRVVSPSR